LKFDPEQAKRRENRLVEIRRRDPHRYDFRRQRRYERLWEILAERQGVCPTCGGMGEYTACHPKWGSPSCPEAYINVRCEDCDGTGTCEIPDVDGHFV